MQLITKCCNITIAKQLCDDIASGYPRPTILTILGQERFRELQSNQLIEENSTDTSNDSMPTSFEEATAMWKAEERAKSNKPSSIKTTQDAIKYIMNEGPVVGVHTILQVKNPNSFLFPEDGRLQKKDLYEKCKHVILMRSEYTALSSLYISDDEVGAAIPKLEDNPNRLRAYYYNEERDKYQLLTPFVLPDKETINNIIK